MTPSNSWVNVLIVVLLFCIIILLLSNENVQSSFDVAKAVLQNRISDNNNNKLYVCPKQVLLNGYDLLIIFASFIETIVYFF